MLSRCAENHYLTGVAVLDRDGDVVQYFSKEGAAAAAAAGADHRAAAGCGRPPEKTYSVRLVCDDDSYPDLCRIGQNRCGRHRSGVLPHPDRLMYTAITSTASIFLAGFTIPGDGTLVVARGDSIIASNDESLLGLAPDAVLPLQLFA